MLRINLEFLTGIVLIHFGAKIANLIIYLLIISIVVIKKL